MRRSVHRLSIASLAALTASAAFAQLGPVGTQFWSQNSPDMPVAIEADANFGYALAAGDFDCDGLDDLAVGMPGEDLVGGDNAGRLIVLYSTEAGVDLTFNQVWGQHSPVIEDDAEANDRFSQVLAAGDFDGNGCDDLAVGVPLEDIGADSNAGAVNVIYGSDEGLHGDLDDFWHQDLATIDAVAEPGDLFGAALAVGDFDGDGIDDLAIGVPGEDIEGEAAVDAGAIHVLWGSIFGLAAGESLTLYRGSGLGGSPQSGEQIGASLAAGDFLPLFPGDDLAVGAPGRDVDDQNEAGAVVLISDLGGSIFDSTWSQNSADVPGAAEDFDNFGYSVAAGDFDGDGIAELAVGAPFEDREGPSISAIGAVNVLDFDGDTHQIWTQSNLPPEQEEENDQFGHTLMAADFDADGVDDLAIAAPFEDLGPVLSSGLLHVLYGEADTGLTADGDQIWIQTIDPSDGNDQFGQALAAGRFAGHSGADLAIGAPFETIGAFSQTGGVNVLYSAALFVDGFESGDTDEWSLEQD